MGGKYDFDKPEPCAKCGEQKEFNCDNDPCLGFLPGVIDACCGHGDRKEAYIHFQDGTVLREFVHGGNAGDGMSEPLWVLNDRAVQDSDINTERTAREQAEAERDKWKLSHGVRQQELNNLEAEMEARAERAKELEDLLQVTEAALESVKMERDRQREQLARALPALANAPYTEVFDRGDGYSVCVLCKSINCGDDCERKWAQSQLYDIYDKENEDDRRT